jgi:hypothetical protein
VLEGLLDVLLDAPVALSISSRRFEGQAQAQLVGVEEVQAFLAQDGEAPNRHLIRSVRVYKLLARSDDGANEPFWMRIVELSELKSEASNGLRVALVATNLVLYIRNGDGFRKGKE